METSRGILSLCFQEAITAVVRLRAGRQTVTDAARFRQQMREALEAAARQARDQGGYAAADIRVATFAVVAFLDESVLNSRAAVFADWARQPLQEELFGTHVAGEVFFDHVRELLGRPDCQSVADLLEVSSLCLLLGFGGRYAGRRGELKGIVIAMRERIRRIRGGMGDLSPSWAPSFDAPPAARDRWTRRLIVAAAAVACLVVLLFAAYSISLAAPLSEIRSIASEVRR